MNPTNPEAARLVSDLAEMDVQRPAWSAEPA